MNEAGDAAAVLRWGLRRYLWLVLGVAIAVGVLLPLHELNKRPVYTAEALVVAVDLQADLKTLPRYGAGIFDNGVVADRVTAQFGDAGDPEDIVPKRASVITEQDSLIMHVQGHARDAQTAADIANTATTAFVTELNKAGTGVGTFARQSQALPPIERDEKLRAAPYSIGLGIVAGLVAGLGVLILLLVVRRPVVSAVGVAREPDLRLFGRITMPPRRRWRKRSPHAPTLGFRGLAPVCRQLLEQDPSTVVLVSRFARDSRRSQLAEALVASLGLVRPVTLASSPGEAAGRRAELESEDPHAEGSDAGIIVVDGPSGLDLLVLGSGTFGLLVVPVGIPLSRLRNLASELRGMPFAVVLTRRRHTRRRATSMQTPSGWNEQPDRAARESTEVAPGPPAPLATAGVARRSVGDDREADVRSAIEWARKEAPSWFPDMVARTVRVSLQGVDERPRGRLLRIDVRGSGEAPRHVLVKLRRDLRQVRDVARSEEAMRSGDGLAFPPALSPPVHGDDLGSSLLEYRGLQLMAAEFGTVDDGSVSALQVFGHNPELAAIAMEFDPTRNLRDVSRQAGTGGMWNADFSPDAPWRHAGLWLRRFHELDSDPPATTRRPTTTDLLELLPLYREFLAPRTGQGRLLAEFVDKVSEAACLELPDHLATGLGHGDFVARNVLVSDTGGIRVIDPFPCWRVPIFEDLGRMMVGARLFEARSPGPSSLPEWPEPRAAERSLLEGYFRDGEVPVAAMRVFLALCTLDKWADTLGKEHAGGLRRRIRRYRIALANRHYRAELRNQMDTLLPSEPRWVESWV
jgi:capsular polysaccharide biosynthesis protein